MRSWSLYQHIAVLQTYAALLVCGSCLSFDSAYVSCAFETVIDVHLQHVSRQSLHIMLPTKFISQTTQLCHCEIAWLQQLDFLFDNGVRNSLTVNCLQVVAYKEACIMKRLEDVPGVCELLDYGVTKDAACLVMPKYEGSVREWRLQQPSVVGHSAERTYLQLLRLATQIVKVGFCACNPFACPATASCSP